MNKKQIIAVFSALAILILVIGVLPAGAQVSGSMNMSVRLAPLVAGSGK